jgi:transcriptional regulator with PAS, ATPase and Fis domain
MPVLFEGENSGELSEREILYKVLFDMKKDLTDLKKITVDLMQKQGQTDGTSAKVFDDLEEANVTLIPNKKADETIDVPQNLSLFQQEKILIERALGKHKGKRKYAAEELGISERTLYRKIKEFDL